MQSCGSWGDGHELQTRAYWVNRYEPSLTNMAQIRASAIPNWLKHYNLREMQYMVGHKYVSSTDRYRMDTLDDLQKEMEKYHPSK